MVHYNLVKIWDVYINHLYGGVYTGKRDYTITKKTCTCVFVHQAKAFCSAKKFEIKKDRILKKMSKLVTFRH